MQICCSTCSLNLNVMATPVHPLIQWHLPPPMTSDIVIFHPCASRSTLLNCQGYMDVVQSILVILTMAGLFPDGPLCVLDIFIWISIQIQIHLNSLIQIQISKSKPLISFVFDNSNHSFFFKISSHF